MIEKNEPIAIVGIGCRFPGGASSPQLLWQLLCQGFDGIVEVPKERWDARRFYDPDPSLPGKMYVNRGGFLQQALDQFDAGFFHLSPREADCLDPQQRLLLEVAWEAMEDGGIVPSAWRGSKTGVFIGAFTTDWQNLSNNPHNVQLGGPYTGINSSQTILSARLSYFFDFKGPCMTVDTACSSSLVALHLACQSIWNKESTMALVGGVNVIMTPQTTIAMSKGRFLSPDGICHSFDAAANGYVRGEGAGLVILKPLKEALHNGDHIYAIIKATGVNHDGGTSGLVVPNGAAQKALIESVIEGAEVGLAPIQYVEAHGTGTPIGDPTEVWALDQVLKKRQSRFLLGSIKSNIGHLEAAAGVAGLIKASLCLRHRQVVPNLHFKNPSPSIPSLGNSVEVPVAVSDFPRTENPLYAGVNSFGYGGTNAHALLEGFSQPTYTKEPLDAFQRPFPFPFSARSQEALYALVREMVAHVEQNPDISIHDLAYTLSKRREHHSFRLHILAQSRAELLQKMRDFLEKRESADLIAGEPLADPSGLAFVFTGMGPQWWGMGRELYKQEEVFKKAIDACDSLLLPLAGWSLCEELTRDETASKMDQPEYSQPANFAIQAALFELLKTWGLMPQAIVGHSIGEVAAAYAAGAITLKEGVLISFHRSRIQAKRKGLGTMLAAEISIEQATAWEKHYAGKVSIAAINSPTTITLSGEESFLQTIAAQLDEQGVFHRFLKVNIAYHSSQMEGLEPDVIEALQGIIPKKPVLPFFSTVYGSEWKDGLDAAYWWKNIRQTVHFEQALASMVAYGCHVFVEIGPHPVLAKAMQEILSHHRCKGTTFYTLNRKESEQKALLRLIARLHGAGVNIAWDHFLSQKGRLIPLPTYPWQRKLHWTESEESRQYRLSGKGHPMFAQRCTSPEEAWMVEVNRHFFPWLEDHKLEESIVFPAAAYVEGGLALHHQRTCNAACRLENLHFHHPLVLTHGAESLLRISAAHHSSTFHIHSLPHLGHKEWTLHATGSFHPLWKGYAPQPFRIQDLKEKVGDEISKDELYKIFSDQGLNYGPTFQRIQRIYRGDGVALSSLSIPEQEDFHLSPPVLDAALQTLIGTVHSSKALEGLILPVHIAEVHFFKKPEGMIWCYAEKKESPQGLFKGDLFLCDEEGFVCVEIRGATCKWVKQDVKAKLDTFLYQVLWEESPADAHPNHSVAGQTWALVCSNAETAAQCTQYLTAHGATCYEGLTHDALAAEDLHILVEQSATELLHLAQLLLERRAEKHCSLWILTSGASPLKGLVRVMQHEIPSCRCHILEADGCGDILPLLGWDELEGEVSVHHGRRDIPKLSRAKLITPNEGEERFTASSDPFELMLTQPGSIENLCFRQSLRRDPGPGEVEIRVHTASLNFKDLMKVMGLLDEKILEGTYYGNTFGMECSGTIVAVGKGVRSIQVGDQVCAFAGNAFSSFLTLSADAVCPIPTGATMEEAPIYIPFITVLRGLKEIAHLKKGETLLIHTASGAVGLAAIQYAQHIGAKIIATAGSAEKRAYLHALGIDNIADSRSSQFARQVMEWTQNKGVDVILNALSGDALLKSWSLLAPYGRFIEIGKRDISQNTGLPMEIFNRNALFAAIDLDRMFVDDRKSIRNLLRSAARYFHEGIFKPLPYALFPASQVKEAFHQMARALHIGKVMLKMEQETVSAIPLVEQKPLFDEGCTYLVTGGLSGFGLATASWIAEKGGRHLLLLSRSGASTLEAQEALKQFERDGVHVTVVKADVGDLDQLKRVFRSITPPLKGIFHCAMVLDDGLIAHINEKRFEKVLHPKVSGCWNLHQLTKEMDLDYFVLYSSISSLIGNPGQASYAAANAYLDAFAQYRHQLNLPALTVNWGAIAEVGVAARHAAVADHLHRSGIRSIPPKHALALLERLLRRPQGQYAVVDVDWERLFASLPELKRESLFAHFVEDRAAYKDSDFLCALKSMSSEDQLSALVHCISEQVAHTLKMDQHKLDATVKMNTLGVDSLMAMELQVAMEQKLGFKIPTMELIRGPSIVELSQSIQKRL